MAIAAKFVEITQPAAGGNNAHTGISLGVAAQAILFLSNGSTSTGSSATHTHILGVCTAADQWCHTVTRADADASPNVCGHARIVNTKCLELFSDQGSAGTLLMGAAFVSFDGSDGNFTLNWNADGTQRKILALVLGGLTNVKAGTFQRPGSTGVQQITTGFTSSDGNGVVIVGSGGLNTSTAPDVEFLNRGWATVGIAASSAKQAVSHMASTNGSTTDGAHKQVAKLILGANDNSIANFDSWHGSDGFNINWTTTGSANNPYFGYLCLNGGSHHIGQYNQPTSTGNQALSGFGLTPIGAMFWSVGAVQSSSLVTEWSRMSVGGATSSSARGSIWTGWKDAVTTSVAQHDYSTSSVIKAMTEGTPTTQAVADFVSNDADGVTINWGTADGTAREFNVWAFGDVVVVPQPVRRIQFNYLDYRA